MAILIEKKIKTKNGKEISIRSANIEDANATLNIKRSGDGNRDTLTTIINRLGQEYR